MRKTNKKKLSDDENDSHPVPPENQWNERDRERVYKTFRMVTNCMKSGCEQYQFITLVRNSNTVPLRLCVVDSVCNGFKSNQTTKLNNIGMRLDGYVTGGI